MAEFEQLMRRALSLAAHGPLVGGNPQVGCILADASGRIVAEGWHRGAGTVHAEIDALSHVADATGLTAIVTLEPCNHTGRTPPCADALVSAGIARVVYATSDPGERSSGGAARLAAAGIDVVGGVLRDEADAAIEPWLTAVRRGRPWVQVKWAQSLDGRAAASDGTSQWITGTAARQRVHEQRAQSDAILVGTGTVFADNPALTARGDAGELLAHQPVPVVIGDRGIPDDSALRLHPAGVIETRSRDLEAILADLHDRGIRRAFVEGGPILASAVIAAGLADEIIVYVAPVLIGGDRLAVGDLGVPTIALARRLQTIRVEQLGDDLMIVARPMGASTTATRTTRKE